MSSPLSAAAAGAWPSPVEGNPTAELRASKADEAAKKFEQLLLFELLKTMRKTTLQDEESGGFAQDTVMGMFDQAIADSAAGSLGIAPMLSRQFGGATSVPRAAKSFEAPVAQPAPTRRPAAAAAAPSPEPRASAGVFGGALPRPGDLPVHGHESSDFGWRIHPITGDKKFHAGIDVAAPEGTEIRAAAAGKVVFAGRHRGYGNMVEIQHDDGHKTRYAHASRLHVDVGDRVDVGEAIADVGSTGMSTGPHLHFEVRKRGHAIDPHRYLEQLRETSEAAESSRPRTGVIDDAG